MSRRRSGCIDRPDSFRQIGQAGMEGLDWKDGDAETRGIRYAGQTVRLRFATYCEPFTVNTAGGAGCGESRATLR